MQPLLEVEGLKKTYPGFQLNGEYAAPGRTP